MANKSVYAKMFSSFLQSAHCPPSLLHCQCKLFGVYSSSFLYIHTSIEHIGRKIFGKQVVGTYCAYYCWISLLLGPLQWTELRIKSYKLWIHIDIFRCSITGFFLIFLHSHLYLFLLQLECWFLTTSTYLLTWFVL